jgi:hypothetical protein
MESRNNVTPDQTRFGATICQALLGSSSWRHSHLMRGSRCADIRLQEVCREALQRKGVASSALNPADPCPWREFHRPIRLRRDRGVEYWYGSDTVSG